MPRRFELEPTPAALVGLLALGLVAQLALPAPSPLSQVMTAEDGHGMGRTVVAETPARFMATPAYPAILDRPLFSPSRSGATAVAGAAPVGALTLLGVASGGGRASATLSEAGGVPRSLRPGEAMEGWRLEHVGADSATLARSGVVQVLRVGDLSHLPAAEPPASASTPAGIAR